MIIAKGDSHKHDYNKIEYIPVTTDNVRYDVSKHGLKAVLIRRCKCGDSVAFEYGTRTKMKLLFKELT
jgi:hypothetical protein